MEITCKLPTHPEQIVICELPEAKPWWEVPTFWTTTSIALLAVVAAGFSAWAAWRSSSTAETAHTADTNRQEAAELRRDDEERRAAELTLFDLYSFVTSGSVRTARSKLMARRRIFRTVRPLVRLYVKDYFELIWALERIYGTLEAHRIAPAEAERVLGFHVRQIQEHIARFHSAQRAAGKFGIENTRTWDRYRQLREKWDGDYPALAATVAPGTPPKDAGERLADPALTGDNQAIDRLSQ